MVDRWWELGESTDNEGDKLELWRITCAFCNEKGNFAIAFHGEKKNPSSDSYRVLPWPLSAKPDPKEHWPDGMKRFWIQAHDCLKNENWDAANVMARSALQFIVRDKNAIEGRLRDQIDDLADKGVLHPLMKEWANEVRLLANDSAHPKAPSPKEITPQDAKDIVNFLDLLLLYLYDLPKQIEDFRRRKNTGVEAN